ncbi:TPA: hypothetical protein OT831_005066 [Klebsiella pneumoniae]|nr:hypothetical protein [Klebsiella pneumoniae]
MEKGYFKVKGIKILQSILFKKIASDWLFFVHPCLSDPISAGSGSASPSPARCGPVTQDLTVLLAARGAICCVSPLPVTRRAAAENRGMIILWPWYTSGNGEIAEKSDLRETGIR